MIFVPDLLMDMAESAGSDCSQDVWDVYYPEDAQKCFIIFGVGCRDRDAARRLVFFKAFRDFPR